jgi:hypothetical protein
MPVRKEDDPKGRTMVEGVKHDDEDGVRGVLMTLIKCVCTCKSMRLHARERERERERECEVHTSYIKTLIEINLIFFNCMLVHHL